MLYDMRLSSVLLALSFAAVSLAQTGVPTPATYSIPYSPVGLAASETMQVNVANTSAIATNVADEITVCTGTVSFYSADGVLIGSATPYSANPGQTISIALPFAKAGTVGNRAVIRAVVTNSIPANSPVYCSLSTSLETFDTLLGVTHVFLTSSGTFAISAIFGGLGGGVPLPVGGFPRTH